MEPPSGPSPATASSQERKLGRRKSSSSWTNCAAPATVQDSPQWRKKKTTSTARKTQIMPNGTYNLIVNGENLGRFGIIGTGMKGTHVRVLRARDGVTTQHKLFIDGSMATDNNVITPNAKVEFREVTA